MTMNAVGVAELKARLSEHLRGVRRGRTLTVMDRDTPIAKIIPHESASASLAFRSPRPDAPKLAAIRMPPPLALKADVLALLSQERDDR